MFIHQYHSREVWRSRGLRIGVDLALACLVWPLLTLYAIGRFTQRNGPTIKARTGKGICRQMVEQCWLALAYTLPPKWYYIFELHDDEKRRRAGQYLQRFETKGGIYAILKEPCRARGTLNLLNDKVAFAAWCQDHHVPAVPVLLALEQGALTYCRGRDSALPRIDLFIKPNYSKGGHGAERWDYQPPGCYQAPDGTRLTEAELWLRLQRLSFPQGCLVQPRVVNHPLIADLSNGALVTVRIITCRNERGESEVTNAVLRMARGRNTVVDNFHAGGIAAKVDLQSGALGRATDQGVRATTGWCDTHPDMGAPILARRLPLWGDTLALVQHAHSVFSDRIFVGWDIALLPDGPQLIEGNGGPDLDIIQRTHEEPVGNARLGQLLAFHLRTEQHG